MSLARSTATVASITLLALGLTACHGSQSPEDTESTVGISSVAPLATEPAQADPVESSEGSETSAGIPEMAREQTDTDLIPSHIMFPTAPDITADDSRLVGVDSAGNSWYVAQHEPGDTFCLELGAVASGAWVVSCGAAPAVTATDGTVTGTYDLDDTGDRRGERLGEHLTVTGL